MISWVKNDQNSKNLINSLDTTFVKIINNKIADILSYWFLKNLRCKCTI